MAGSQETFGKKEREKKRLKKKKDKLLRKEERKASGQDSMFVYVDEFGQLTDTPPDPAKKIKVDAESIEIGIPKKEDREEEAPVDRQGKVSFFDTSKSNLHGLVKSNSLSNSFSFKMLKFLKID